MANIAILPVRFQNSFLHEGHRKLIDYAGLKNHYTIIVLGVAPTRLTYNNPLSFEIRKQMVQAEYPKVRVESLPDYKYDDVWSLKLDDLIETIIPDQNRNSITLYGGRDSFINSYTGKHNTLSVNSISINKLSASDIRTVLHNKIENDQNWRSGIIYASAHRYPVSFQTVDIAVVDFERYRVLVAKKPHEKLFRFVGGFVDPTDISLETAAKRETMEETGMIETDDYKYIGSYRIDDWRYRKSKDKIMTAFFTCKFISGIPKASDDISMVEWKTIYTMNELEFEPEHRPLFNDLKKLIQ